jgi:hypothetical protein
LGVLAVVSAVACNADSMRDGDGDGFPASEDCADDDPDSHPGASEICDGRDNDCDGAIDEGMDTSVRWEDRSYGSAPVIEVVSGPLPVQWSNLWANGGLVVSGAPDPTGSAGNLSQPVANIPNTYLPFVEGQHLLPFSALVDAGDPARLDPDTSTYPAAGWDCDDLDPDIHPGAVQIGTIDTNCDGI